MVAHTVATFDDTATPVSSPAAPAAPATGDTLVSMVAHTVTTASPDTPATTAAPAATTATPAVAQPAAAARPQWLTDACQQMNQLTCVQNVIPAGILPDH